MKSRGRSRDIRKTTLEPLGEIPPPPSPFYSGHYSGNRNNQFYRSLNRHVGGRIRDETKYIEEMSDMKRALREEKLAR